MDGSSRTWSIAELAEEFGVTHRTIRFYEDRGLVTPERIGTRRVYHPRDRALRRTQPGEYWAQRLLEA